MKFENSNSKPVKEIRSFMNEISKDVGIYCWWFKDSCVQELLKEIPVDFKELNSQSEQHRKFDGEKYTALYVGITAAQNGIRSRFKWHLEKHTVSKVKNGRLSTLRRTISALRGWKLLKSSSEINQSSENELNEFMDENCILEWICLPGKSKQELEKKENEIIQAGYYPLNIQGNGKTSDEVRNRLKELRKDFSSWPEFFTHEDLTI